MVGKPRVVSDDGLDEDPDKGDVRVLKLSFSFFTADFMEAGVGKPKVVSDEGIDEKPSKIDGAAPDGANTGFVAVVSEAGAVWA